MTTLLLRCLFTFVGLLFTGFPIAFVLGGVAMLFTLVGFLSDMYLGTITGIDFQVVGMVANRIYKLMDNWVLVAIPMFIFMGMMMDRSGIAEKMMHSMQDLFGKVRGGLAITVTLIGVILAASTGIVGALGGPAGSFVPAHHVQPGIQQNALPWEPWQPPERSVS